MRKLMYVSLIIAAVFMLSGCASLKKMIKNADDINYKMEPEVLEMHGGKVELKIVGQFPEKYFSKKVEAEITPVIVWEGGEKALTPIYIQGEKIKENNQVINYKAGGQFTYTDKVDYVDGMKVSRVELRIHGKQGKKEQDFEPELLGYGVVVTPLLVSNTAQTVSEKDKFVKDIASTKIAVINYDKNQSNLKNTELKKEEVVEMQKYIVAVDTNDRIEFTGVVLKSYASPEGTVERNTDVSGGRDKAAQGFVAKEFKKIKDAENKEFVKTEVVVEDWDGFKKSVQESSLPEKDMVLRVVQMHSDPNVREQEIRNMSKTFDALETEIHPKLRRSEVYVNVMLIGNTDDEIKAIYAKNSDELAQEEFLYCAFLYTDNNKKLEIYTKYTEKFNKDWRGFNNLGVVQYELNNLTASKTALEKAKSLNANATIFNNLGNVCLGLGEIEAAKEYYASATGIKEASFGQGIISVKEGKYKAATEYFGSDCSFNNALALLLNKNYDDAIAKASCGPEKENAMNYYLKAIAYARKGNKDEMFNNLRTAVSKDDSLKGKAKNDMEFFKYFEDATFKEIIK
ncbi:MAG TPA: tetratricopeptide repeat protein [Bacteroidales bacterium]|nr:tetratricopeptide repeat protein [Bacteroidales bacterium]